MQEFDVIVIGAGPGGYAAAVKSAQLGLNVACVEKRETLGGTCLNVGCIPSKALLDSSEKYHELTTSFANHGIKCEGVQLDLQQMMTRKNQVVTDLTRGMDGLFRKNKVTKLIGTAKILNQNQVEISNGEIISAKNIIIATGSDVAGMPGINIDEKRIVSSTGALALEEVPQKMIVIGGGVIGLEMASVWGRLGSEIEIVEFADRIVASVDEEIGQHFQKSLMKQGMKFRLSTKVTSARVAGDKVAVEIQSVAGDGAETLECDVLLVSIGRRPYTQGLGLEELGVNVDPKGRVVVNDNLETNIKGIYAIGDVIAGPMLAHKAEEEGVAVAEIISGHAESHAKYAKSMQTIPSVVYTFPEVASVGKTEQELKQESVEYKVGKFPFMANGRARAAGHIEGMVKILSCAKTNEIFGAHVMGASAGTMIAELTLAMARSATPEDIARTVHAHPTLSEAIKESALSIVAKPLYM